MLDNVWPWITGDGPPDNLENPDPECDLDYTALVAKEKNRTAINNSFGFGGHNATLVLTEYTG
jgi:3-oxoacyl-[acyl-carrier-protein] synthase II